MPIVAKHAMVKNTPKILETSKRKKERRGESLLALQINNSNNRYFNIGGVGVFHVCVMPVSGDRGRPPQPK